MALLWASVHRATHDQSRVTPTGTGTMSTDTANPVRTGAALKIALTTGQSGYYTPIGTGVTPSAGGRASALYRFSVLPSNSPRILRIGTAGATAFGVRLLATGALDARANATTFATGTTVLSVNTNYLLEWAYTIVSTTSFSFSLWINGVAEITYTQSVAGGTLGTATPDQYNLGAYDTWTVAGATSIWIDDWVALDGDVSTGRPGTTATGLRTEAKRPVANGGTNTFATLTGTGSGYGAGRSIYVNDRPQGTANQITQTVSAVVRDDFLIEAPSVGDNNIAGAKYVGCIYWAHGSGIATTDQLVNNGSSTAPTDPANFATSGMHYITTTGTSYPTNTTATPAIGFNRTAGSATAAILNDCGVLVVYEPGAAARGALLGVGA